MRAKGWAVKTADGQILVRTISNTPRGAQVNWLYVAANVTPTISWSDERIAREFEAATSTNGAKIVKVDIVEDLTT